MLDEKLHTRQITNVLYTSTSGKTSERTIIPTRIPSTNITALDVTHLEQDKQEELVKLYSEYSEYLAAHMATASRFEDYVELAHPDVNLTDTVKWRTFVAENLESTDMSEDPSS